MSHRDEQPEDDMDLAHHARGESSDDVRDAYDHARLRLLSPFFAFRPYAFRGAEEQLNERRCSGPGVVDAFCDGAEDAPYTCWRHDNVTAVAARLHRMVRRRALLVLSRAERYELARFAADHGWYDAARVLIGGGL